MATIADLVKAGKTRRNSGTIAAKTASAVAQTTPVLRANPNRVSWLIAAGSADAGRIARKPGLVTDTIGVPLDANDGIVSEAFETAGAIVTDAIFVKMANNDATLYFEEVEVVE